MALRTIPIVGRLQNEPLHGRGPELVMFNPAGRSRLSLSQDWIAAGVGLGLGSTFPVKENG